MSLQRLPTTGSGGVFAAAHGGPYKENDEAVLTCGLGYKAPDKGVSKVVQTARGLAWEPATIDCLLLSELTELPQVTQGGAVTSTKQPPYRIKDEARLVCDKGYSVPQTSVSTVVVKKGVLAWEPETLQCVPRSCGQPFIPDHGSTSNRDFYFPKSFRYECDEGYRLNPTFPRKYFCLASGEWYPKTHGVRCEPVECPELKAPANGTISFYNRIFESTADFACDRDYIMVKGDATRVCQADGTWSGEEVECGQIPCPAIDPRAKIAFQNDALALIDCGNNRTVPVKCMPTGKWSMPYPYCGPPPVAIQPPVAIPPPVAAQPPVAIPPPVVAQPTIPQNLKTFSNRPVLPRNVARPVGEKSFSYVWIPVVIIFSLIIFLYWFVQARK